MKKIICLCTSLAIVLIAIAQGKASKEFSGNPLFPGWYADPDGAIFKNTVLDLPDFFCAVQ